MRKIVLAVVAFAIPITAASVSNATSPYRPLLGAWLESHKNYPQSAREHGEEGQVVLRFSVDRSGRVIDFAITKSSGYLDLDAAVENMMRGASLPPFPADMPESSIKASVAIRFSLPKPAIPPAEVPSPRWEADNTPASGPLSLKELDNRIKDMAAKVDDILAREPWLKFILTLITNPVPAPQVSGIALRCTKM
jgi:TonB family protein